jgi:hypothetical protein
MYSDESLRLANRFELPHSPLSHPGGLMRLFYPIVTILRGVMVNIWHQFPVSNTITPQFVRHNLPGHATITSQ